MNERPGQQWPGCSLKCSSDEVPGCLDGKTFNGQASKEIQVFRPGGVPREHPGQLLQELQPCLRQQSPAHAPTVFGSATAPRLYRLTRCGVATGIDHRMMRRLAAQLYREGRDARPSHGQAANHVREILHALLNSNFGFLRKLFVPLHCLGYGQGHRLMGERGLRVLCGLILSAFAPAQLDLDRFVIASGRGL